MIFIVVRNQQYYLKKIIDIYLPNIQYNCQQNRKILPLKCINKLPIYKSLTILWKSKLIDLNKWSPPGIEFIFDYKYSMTDDFIILFLFIFLSSMEESDQLDQPICTEIQQEINQEEGKDHDDMFDGTEFDYGEFCETITEISRFSSEATNEDRVLIIQNLIDKMKCMAVALNNLNSRNKYFQTQIQDLITQQQKDKEILENQSKGIIELQALSKEKLQSEKEIQKIEQIIQFKNKEYQQIILTLENRFNEQEVEHQKKIEEIMAKLKASEDRCVELSIGNQENLKIIQSMEEELGIICKYAEIETMTGSTLKKKLMGQDNNLLVLGAEQLNQLKEYANKMQKQSSIKNPNKSLEMISEESEEDADSQYKAHADIFKGVDSPTSPITRFKPCKSSEKNIGPQNLDCIEQIKQLKNLLQKRSSLNSDFTSLQQIEPLQPSLKQQIKNLKQQSQKFKASQSQQASQILTKLDQTRQTRIILINHLEQELQKLKETQLAHQKQEQQEKQEKQYELLNCQEKIEEMMGKIEEMEENRVRNQKLLTDGQKKLGEKCKENQQLEGYIKKVQKQNHGLIDKIEQLKSEIVDNNQNIQKLESTLKSTTTLNIQLTQQKSQLESSLTQNKQLIKSLQTQITQLQQALLNQQANYQQLQDSQQQLSEQLNKSMKDKFAEYELCIEELEEKLMEGLEQKKEIEGKLGKSQQELRKVRKECGNIKEELERAKADYRVIEKSNSDYRYMNELLKKDICKVREIQNRNWLKQPEDLKQSRLKQNQPYILTKRSSNYSNAEDQKSGRKTDRYRINSSFISEASQAKDTTYENKPKIPTTGSSIWTNIRARNTGSHHYEPKNQPIKKQENTRELTQNIRKKYML